MTSTSLTRLLEGFSRQGRALIERYTPRASLLRGSKSGEDLAEGLEELANALLSTRGEASGVALASDLFALYAIASGEQRLAFFRILGQRFGPNRAALIRAFARYESEGDAALGDLNHAVEAPRQELFRRLNLAPGGTAALVGMRADLLGHLRSEKNVILGPVDLDLVHLLQSWFNRGFLTMRAIRWDSPASLLERVIQYEAVHDIRDWDDLRRRLQPADRRCYGFFHPSLPDEPLIFVEVALTETVSVSVDAILASDRLPIAAEEASAAIFYSISNCQPGLKGVSFGHFLIKQVAADLKRDLPNLETFATLSPLPGFLAWMKRTRGDDPMLAQLTPEPPSNDEALRSHFAALVVAYLVGAKNSAGKPLDPVARFHLGNGARFERINWRADRSPKGYAQSGGLMVNYLYDLGRIEENHESYADHGTIDMGAPVRRIAEQLAKTRK